MLLHPASNGSSARFLAASVLARTPCFHSQPARLGAYARCFKAAVRSPLQLSLPGPSTSVVCAWDHAARSVSAIRGTTPDASAEAAVEVPVSSQWDWLTVVKVIAGTIALAFVSAAVLVVTSPLTLPGALKVLAWLRIKLGVWATCAELFSLFLWMCGLVMAVMASIRSWAQLNHSERAWCGCAWPLDLRSAAWCCWMGACLLTGSGKASPACTFAEASC